MRARIRCNGACIKPLSHSVISPVGPMEVTQATSIAVNRNLALFDASSNVSCFLVGGLPLRLGSSLSSCGTDGALPFTVLETSGRESPIETVDRLSFGILLLLLG